MSIRWESTSNGMKLIYALSVGLMSIVFCGASFVFAQDVMQTGASQSRVWGVTVSDPGIDAIRNQMIQQVGVDAVVTARFAAAVNRLSILDTRITTLLENTSNDCSARTSAAEQLADARSMLRSVDQTTLFTRADTTASMEAIAMDTSPAPASMIDSASARQMQVTLDETLAGMRTAVTTVAQCPEYITQSEASQQAEATSSVITNTRQ